MIKIKDFNDETQVNVFLEDKNIRYIDLKVNYVATDHASDILYTLIYEEKLEDGIVINNK